MRLFVVCLLSLGITVQGYAGVQVMDASCPMLNPAAATASHEGHGASMDHAGMHHAGLDHSHMGHEGAGHGKHCQHDVGCQSAGPAMAATLVVLVCGPSAQQLLTATAPSFRSHTPPLLARPPALA